VRGAPMPKSDSAAAGLPGGALRLVPPVETRRHGAPVIELQGRDAARGRICSHWPMHAPDGIHAASEALLGLAKLWEQAERLMPASEPDPCIACTPDGDPADGIDLDLLLLKADEVPDAARTVTRALVDLAQQFFTVAQWLTRAAQTSCMAVQHAPCLQQSLGAPREDHRSIARDFLCADMNAAIARLLMRTAQTLDSLVLPVQSIRDDLLGARNLQEPLRVAGTMLERARNLTTESAKFVESFDHQWADLRARAVSTMALAPLNIAAAAVIQPT